MHLNNLFLNRLYLIASGPSVARQLRIRPLGRKVWPRLLYAYLVV